MPAIEFHEAADLFPMDEGTIPALAEDIRKNGQLVTIKRFGGKVLDGRRRLKACEILGVKPRFEDVNPPDPIAYALSINLVIRHLTPGQRAMVGARASEVYERQAKERMSEGGKSAGKGRPKQGQANLPDPVKGQARDKVGKVVGVGGKTIDHAMKVLKNAVPEVVRAVDEGRMAVSTAALLSTEPEDKQREEATHPKRKRNYRSVSVGQPQGSEPEEEEEVDPKERKVMGKGITLAEEAINILRRIPKNDALRKRGFQLVADFLRNNK